MISWETPAADSPRLETGVFRLANTFRIGPDLICTPLGVGPLGSSRLRFGTAEKRATYYHNKR